MTFYYLLRKIGSDYKVVLLSTNERERDYYLIEAESHYQIMREKFTGAQLVIWDGEMAVECQPYIQKLNALELADAFERVREFNVRMGAGESENNGQDNN